MMIKKIAAALAGAAIISLCSCSVGFVNSTNVRYENDDKYTAGNIEISDRIDTLDIEWPTGRLDIYSAETESVTVKETTEDSLDDKEKVHTWHDGSKLHIRFCKSGERYTGEEKKLEISVPKSFEMENIKINVSSADVSCTGLTAKTAELNASSGNISFEGDAASFLSSSSSGNIIFNGTAEKIDTSASSGKVTITQKGRADSIITKTSSGEITIDAEYADTISANSSSGDKRITLAEMPQKTTLISSSGDVKLTLPDNPDFDLNIETSSGDISYEMPLSKTDDNNYTCGNGGNMVSISTSSGNVQILKK